MKRIPLTQGKFAIVDDNDFEWISKIKWYARKDRNNYYAENHKGNRKSSTKMHRMIINAPEGFSVDHINGDGLDNQRKNLRLCTTEENTRNRDKQKNNTTGYKGVTIHKKTGLYQAQTTHHKKHVSFGYFKTAKEAARAYDKNIRLLHKDFSKTNFDD